MQELIHTSTSKTKHKTENHGENIYCRPIYGLKWLNTKKKKYFISCDQGPLALNLFSIINYELIMINNKNKTKRYDCFVHSFTRRVIINVRGSEIIYLIYYNYYIFNSQRRLFGPDLCWSDFTKTLWYYIIVTQKKTLWLPWTKIWWVPWWLHVCTI